MVGLLIVSVLVYSEQVRYNIIYKENVLCVDGYNLFQRKGFYRSDILNLHVKVV